ncbi:MAG: molybdopterin-guanine dinucleotide biosynthesis protein B [Deltaproteobacteria bacterium]|nr:molybdopterin-guanine dinucleotide biosynthesis protein B [Deltaproteobacteria bacterium]MCD6264824.1 molybdopterin-guanine dinucleotide biosynthesis protein B [Deltaproteobacteria bacterium]RLB23125.1 MAG: molybdopterin-guanine dinucleotide biosynthesis protein B [Deltaproteobacteria bacterium]
MKAVGVIGYKKSGKTTLIIRLAQELSSMGYSVAILKHVPGNIDFQDSDTSKFRSFVPFVSAISPGESEIILKGKKHIGDILKYVDCDIVLIEGFKKEKTFPKIVCIKEEENKNKLFDGLEIATAGFDKDIVDFDISNDDHIKKLAALVSEKSFKLPNLNCGHCGYETCFGLAKEIVKGKKTISNCVSLNPSISIKVDGVEFPLNPFMSNLFKNSFLAMLSSLKGFKKGRIEIEIP